MAWVNVFDVVGLTITQTYSGGEPSPAPTIIGKKLVFPAGAVETPQYNYLLVTDDGALAAAPEFPLIHVRCTYDLSGQVPYSGQQSLQREASPSGLTYEPPYGGPGGGDAPFGPIVDHWIYSGGGSFRLGASYDGAFLVPMAGVTMMIEVDITYAPPPSPTAFWTDFAGTKETI